MDGARGGGKGGSQAGDTEGRGRAAGQIRSRCSLSHRADVDRARGLTEPNEGSRFTFCFSTLFLKYIFIYFKRGRERKIKIETLMMKD